MKIKTGIITLLFFLVSVGSLFAAPPIKIAFINMDKAVNLSDAGKRSKQLIRAKMEEMKTSLSKQREQISLKQSELQNSMMLSAEAKQKKEQEYMLLVNKYKQDEQKANEELREQEQRHIKNIYEDLTDVIKQLAKKRKIDLVLEQRTILYSRDDWEDITETVIKTYNKNSKTK